MDREIRIVVVADNNTAEAREVISRLSENATLPQTVVTPQLVRKIIPVRANPAIGVMFWSTDLQGMVADVEAFAAYVKGEAEVKEAAHIAQRSISDEEALKQPAVLVRTWEEVLKNQERLFMGDKIRKGEQLYNVEQETQPQEVYPPDGEGMLAIYRPINVTHAGTLEDPIQWVYGMDCEAGKFYTYNDEVYRCDGDMKPCVWAPDSGIWQWVKM